MGLKITGLDLYNIIQPIVRGQENGRDTDEESLLIYAIKCIGKIYFYKD